MSGTGAIFPEVSLQGSMSRNDGGNAFFSESKTDALLLNVSMRRYVF